MPRGDGTGPAGMGPMTGRAAGFCAGYGMPGYANPIFGRGGMGFGGRRGMGGFWFGGRGRGWGWRNMMYGAGYPVGMRAGGYGVYPIAGQNPDPELEKQDLKAQAEFFETELSSIRKRLDELESGDK
ncbi:MAG: DUF5320 domain-containing protein [Candidatus Ratteibacteria bacterium]|jgi:hypothetical protein